MATLALLAQIGEFVSMSVSEIVKELETLPRSERTDVARRALESLCSDAKVVERALRRIENPDVPEDVWRGIEDAEDGRLVDMETALREAPPRRG